MPHLNMIKTSSGYINGTKESFYSYYLYYFVTSSSWIKMFITISLHYIMSITLGQTTLLYKMPSTLWRHVLYTKNVSTHKASNMIFLISMYKGNLEKLWQYEMGIIILILWNNTIYVNLNKIRLWKLGWYESARVT